MKLIKDFFFLTPWRVTSIKFLLKFPYFCHLPKSHENKGKVRQFKTFITTMENV